MLPLAARCPVPLFPTAVPILPRCPRSCPRSTAVMRTRTAALPGVVPMTAMDGTHGAVERVHLHVTALHVDVTHPVADAAGAHRHAAGADAVAIEVHAEA